MADKDPNTPPKPKPGELIDTIVQRELGATYAGELMKAEDIVTAKGGQPSLYARILQDDQVKSTLQQRLTAVTSRPWEVRAGGDAPIDKEAAAFVEEQLACACFDDKLRKMLYGVFYGYAVAEMIWAFDGSRVVIDQIKVRKRERFKFDTRGNLRFITRDNPKGLELPERKFWVFATGADNDDAPYGLGLAHWLYWPCFFKRNDLRMWLTFLDKFASPSVKGTYGHSATKEEKDKLLEAAEALRNESSVVIPEGMELELVEAARTATGTYDELYDRMDAAISKIVLSQTMTTDDGSSLSQAEVHEGVRDAVVEADAGALANSLNGGPVHWLSQWNFPGAAVPEFKILTEDEEDQADAIERDLKLYQMGWEPTEERIRTVYGEGYVRRTDQPSPPGGADEDAADPAVANPAFAENDETDIIDRFIDAELIGEWEEIMDPVAAPLLDLMESAASYEEFIDRLPTVLPDMNVDKVRTHLARAAFSARIAGNSGADQDDA